MAWVSVGVSAASALSGIFGAKKQAKSQAELQNYQRSLRLDPVTGQYGEIGVQNGNVNLGAFGGLQGQLTGGAGDVLGGIDFNSGLPPEVMAAFQRLGGFSGSAPGAGAGGMGSLLRGAGGAGNLALGNLFGANAQADQTQSQLFSQLGSGFEDQRTRTLDLLRQQARPEEDRQFQGLQQNLFSTGRLGTTGGAMQTEAFARGLGQADLTRQLAAGDEARASATDLMARLGLSENLRGAAFTNFGNVSDLQRGLSGDVYNRQQQQDTTGYQRATDMFQGILGLQQVPTQLQQGRLGLFQQLLGGAGTIQGFGMDAQQAALAQAVAGTNVRTAGAGLATQTFNSPNFSASPVSDAFQSLFGGMVRPGQPSLMDLLGNLGKTKPTIPQGTNQGPFPG